MYVKNEKLEQLRVVVMSTQTESFRFRVLHLSAYLSEMIVMSHRAARVACCLLHVWTTTNTLIATANIRRTYLELRLSTSARTHNSS